MRSPFFGRASGQQRDTSPLGQVSWITVLHVSFLGIIFWFLLRPAVHVGAILVAWAAWLAEGYNLGFRKTAENFAALMWFILSFTLFIYSGERFRRLLTKTRYFRNGTTLTSPEDQ